LRWIGEARTVFPQEHEEVPTFLATDFGMYQVRLFEGLTYLALGKHTPEQGHYQQAWQQLQHVDTLPPHEQIPERMAVELVNLRASAAVGSGELEDARKQLLKGVEGAKLLNSKKRLQEARATWKHACTIWRSEVRMQELQEIFV
jgi:predicted negative regulator of RcsB-dependent stress response